MRLAAVAGAITYVLLRFGVRGEGPVRLLARSLNLSAQMPRFAKRFTSAHGKLYVLGRGRLGRFWFGMPVLVLETVGRRSGRVRRTPIIYARDGERFVVTPANAGTDSTPAWWLNLRASGSGSVFLGGRRTPVRAREVTGEERDRLWQLLVDLSPAIADYQRFTDRRLPVVVLEPAG